MLLILWSGFVRPSRGAYRYTARLASTEHTNACLPSAYQQWNKIHQLGSVVIMDNVDIGANTTIDRGALQDTIIHEGVKIDNQVQIGHNCEILDHSIIAGCVGIAGSTKIGKFCKIGGAAMILGHLEIAENTTISPGTMISKSIKIQGKTFTGIFPFFEKNDWIKVTMLIKRLLRKRD